ncbi:MAG: sulfite exporter TauE/SafE family protein [Nonlabens sp.]
MEWLDLMGYAGAVIIGLVLGLIGGGGSILTVPILVYALMLEPVVATAYSLFVVGATSLVGTVRNMVKKKIDYRTAIIFSIPAFIAVYCTRAFIVPAIPDQLFNLSDFPVTKDLAIMLFFAFIMLVAAFSMLKNKKDRDVSEGDQLVPFNYFYVVLEGTIVGVITGLVGAGGGFLIVPVLVLLTGLEMKKAVATSLFIVAVKSLIGFIGDVQNLDIDWIFLLTFTSLSIVGIFIGLWLNNFIDGKRLKKGFGVFVVLMAIYILYKELL